VLFIADEVMTGWGRTGTLFACEQAGISPDILCTGKGLTGGSVPLAATLASSAIFDAHVSTERAKMFFHSSSFTANAIACAAANANIAIWRGEDVLGRIEVLAEALDEGLATLAERPDMANARRIGGIAAIDLLGAVGAGYLADAAPILRARLLAAGFLVRPLGHCIYVMPPYCTSTDEIAALFAGIHDAVAELAC
jgi:adenosylmethionine---8-amino-7-oxononanoate aminotransferase